MNHVYLFHPTEGERRFQEADGAMLLRDGSWFLTAQEAAQALVKDKARFAPWLLNEEEIEQIETPKRRGRKPRE